MPRCRIRRRPGGDRGAAVVEFAAILPVFLGLVVGLLRFGEAIHVHLELSTAAQEAARVRSLPFATDTQAKDAAVTAAAVQPALMGEPTDTFNVQVVPSTTSSGNSCYPARQITVVVVREREFDFILAKTPKMKITGKAVRCG